MSEQVQDNLDQVFALLKQRTSIVGYLLAASAIFGWEMDVALAENIAVLLEGVAGLVMIFGIDENQNLQQEKTMR